MEKVQKTLWIIILLFTLSCCCVGESELFEWVVYVYDSHTELPLEGVSVTFYRINMPGSVYTVTGNNGLAHMGFIGCDLNYSYEAVCNKDGYMEQSVIVHANETQFVYLERVE